MEWRYIASLTFSSACKEISLPRSVIYERWNEIDGWLVATCVRPFNRQTCWRKREGLVLEKENRRKPRILCNLTNQPCPIRSEERIIIFPLCQRIMKLVRAGTVGSDSLRGREWVARLELFLAFLSEPSSVVVLGPWFRPFFNSRGFWGLRGSEQVAYN